MANLGTSLRLLSLLLCLYTTTSLSFKNPVRTWTKDIKIGYDRRVAADASFPQKSIAEVLLAAGTQLTAEWQRRGAERLLPEAEFVIAGVLTAVVGKYFSMWKVAQTQLAATTKTTIVHHKQQEEDADSHQDPSVGGMKVPTNAFQATMLDGITVPSSKQRLGSLVAPIVPLFRAGVIASALGYGMTAGIFSGSSVRTKVVTQQVNIVYACLYTGAFMAVVSNLRYQILQGLVEPAVDKWLRKVPLLRAVVIFSIRIGNGLLGSILAISGMRWLGLQKLK